MLMTNNPHAGDCRRACSILVHHSQNDLDGVNALLQEAADTGRVTELVFAILDAYQGITPVLLTAIGMACLSQTVHGFASPDNPDDDSRRASALIIAHARDDIDAINKVIVEVKQANRVSPWIVAILNVYRTLVPAIATPLGVESLSRSVLNLAAKEVAE